MTKPKGYILHPLKFAAALITAIVCFVLGICSFLISRPFSAVSFIGICLLFSLTAFYNGSRITVCSNGVYCSAAGKKIRFIPWDSMKEVGVFGSRLSTTDKSRPGTLYIYFSAQTLTEKERFQMVLHGPARDKIILQYSKERMETVQLLWSSEIQTCNTGDFHF